MNKLVLVAFVAVIGFACARPDEKYTDKYDDIDLDELFKSNRLIEFYFKCIHDGIGCNPAGTELKRIIPDALQNECAKCSEKQKDGARKVIHFLIEKRRDLWDKLEKKYDSEGTYRKKYEELIKREGVAL